MCIYAKYFCQDNLSKFFSLLFYLPLMALDLQTSCTQCHFIEHFYPLKKNQHKNAFISSFSILNYYFHWAESNLTAGQLYPAGPSLLENPA